MQPLSVCTRARGAARQLQQLSKTFHRWCFTNVRHGASPQAPQIAKKYWKLGDEAGMRELLLAVRADEAGALLCLDSLNSQTPKNTQKQVLLALRLAF